MERGQFFHWSWNYKDYLNQYIKKENIKKDLVNLTEANHHINTTCNLLQAITRLKAFWMLRVSTCSSHCNSCAKQGEWFCFSVCFKGVTYMGDGNSASGENWKEPSSSAISTEASFNGDSNEKNS